eukprot:m.50895 g.50895  ORF g.50895 m.50895 type:complete len:1039 (+) comp12182_c0_seq1:107-3223(+)
MLVKEYRILLPLELEDYRRAQLFMVNKKSETESHGGNSEQKSGVEILENEPYTDGPGGNGQYTRKIYHVGSKLPGWLRSILPANALCAYEEAWNAYPYTKTRFTSPFIEKFSIEVETVFCQDAGTQDNLFKLKGEELKREVDFIDWVNDPVDKKHYKEDEDPQLFVSKVTGRGPLGKGWQDASSPVMCAYKLCKVEFRYWGLQSKIERFVHKAAIRDTLLVAHRQAWCWQDEWFHLTMEDIRRQEKETQKKLMSVMRGDDPDASGEALPVAASAAAGSSAAGDDGSRSPRGSIVRLSLDGLDGSEGPGAATGAAAPFEAHKGSVALLQHDDVIRPADEDTSAVLPGGFESDDSDEFFDAEGDEQHVADAFAGVAVGGEMRPAELLQPLAPAEHLVLVVHGQSFAGSSLPGVGKDFDNTTDFETFSSTLAELTCDAARIQCRSVVCEYDPSPASVLKQIAALRPKQQGMQSHVLPVHAAALLMLGQQSSLRDCVQRTAQQMNDAYEQFVEAADGFDGEVHVVGDAVGAAVVFQLLSKAAESLRFVVADFFSLGSPIGLQLLQGQRAVSEQLPPPHCRQLYNIFQPTDPLAFRIEPQLAPDFVAVPAASVPSVTMFPRGNGPSFNLFDCLNASAAVGQENLLGTSLWWGSKRIDYQLPGAPEGIDEFGSASLLHLMHASYWECRDAVSFISRTISGLSDSALPLTAAGGMSQTQREVELDIDTFPSGWRHRHTALKVAGLSANHVCRDIVCSSDNAAQIMVTGRFVYGAPPLRTASVVDEDVTVLLLDSQGTWVDVGSCRTQKKGHCEFRLPPGCVSAPGEYPVKLLLQADNTTATGKITVVRPGTPAVVFSIDGAFAESLSVSGANPRVRARAVDVVRHWSQNNCLIVYVSARPESQRRRVVSWLAKHNFPGGTTWFARSLRKPYTQKTQYLQSLVAEAHVEVQAAYGKARDAPVYHALGVPSHRVFLFGLKRDETATAISGYGEHLGLLQQSGAAAKAVPTAKAAPATLLSATASSSTNLSGGQANETAGRSHTSSTV